MPKCIHQLGQYLIRQGVSHSKGEAMDTDEKQVGQSKHWSWGMWLLIDASLFVVIMLMFLIFE
jgi:hypothetical protein